MWMTSVLTSSCQISTATVQPSGTLAKGSTRPAICVALRMESYSLARRLDVVNFGYSFPLEASVGAALSHPRPVT